MTVLLKDAPGAREFFNLIVNEAENIAVVVAGKPDHEVSARLRESNDNLKRKLEPLIGAEAAAGIADIFGGIVMGQKHERETLAAMRLLGS